MGGRGGSSQPDTPPPKATFSIGAKEFKSWYDRPEGNLVIPNLPSHIKEALGTEADSLIFSAETLEKQGKHKDLKAEDYVSVLNKIKDCTEIFPDGPNHVRMLVESGGKGYRLVLKATQDRREVYLSALYRQTERDMERVRRGRG